jgi:hypothetical protein
MTADQLAQALLDAVRAQDFGATPDALQGGGPVAEFPSLDLAVAAFPPDAPPVWANVLFSREHPQGLVGEIGSDGGGLRNVSFLADVRDAAGVSIAWQLGADWSRIAWQPLHGSGSCRAVAPYPASLLKLMVAVGVGLAFDAGGVRWDQAWPHAGRSRTVDAWCTDMIAISCNESTSAMVALLHAQGLLAPARHALHESFAGRGLHTLRLDGTQPDGGWGNAAGAGVGRIQMTAWDTVRLLWLLDPAAPPTPWLDAAPLLSVAARDRLLAWLRAQQLHHVLGLPADADFLHKTGTTENYGSDAGIVRGRAPNGRHYLIALLSNLGSRYAPGAVDGETNERLRQLGAAVDALMRRWLEAGALP